MALLQLQLSQSTICVLGLNRQQQLTKIWDKIILDQQSFVPREVRGTVGESEIVFENNQLGGFAARQIRKVCEQSSPVDIIRRQLEGRKILAIGYGQGWDSGTKQNQYANWLPDVTDAGLQTHWLDVSGEACKLAKKQVSESWAQIYTTKTALCPPPPVVMQGDLRSVLLDPSSVDLDLDQVEVFYLCRTLFALSERGARVALQIMGTCLSDDKDTEKNKRVILINPLKGDNPHRLMQKSINLSKKMILCNLCLGADRKLKVTYDYHWYFGRRYTAMTIQAE